MKTIEYNELPEAEQLRAYAYYLDHYLNILPAQYEYEKREQTEGFALEACKESDFVEVAGSYFRVELKEI